MSDSPALQKACPQCGATLPFDATEGLCPHCLLSEVMAAQASDDSEDANVDSTIPLTKQPGSSPRPAVPELPLPEELNALLPQGMYRVDSFIGQGGMGAVYKGTQIRLKRPVAIKIMRRDFGKDHDFEHRFEREAQAMAQLNHPHIVGVHDFGEAGPDYLYIVMELVEGADLMDVIRTGRMTQEMALTLLPQICDALQFAHDHGIVHRDIKPSNIMLTRDGQIKIADFGLAKRVDFESNFSTQAGTGMGSPDYAAPEQFIPNALIDHRADIFALGVMIYQMITGQLPRGVWKPPSERASVDTQWDDIVSHAMQSDPKDRYQHASEIKTDVSKITTKTEGPASERARPAVVPRRKSRAPLIVGLVAVLAIGAFFATRKPEATSVPAVSPSSRAPASNDWGDLLARVDVQRDSFFKPWRLEDGALKSPTDDQGAHQTIALPVKNVLANYDLRYRVTRTQPGNSIKFFFIQGTGGGLVAFDGRRDQPGELLWFGGLSNITTSSREKDNWLMPGDMHEVVIQVRESSVAVVFDGQEISRAEGRSAPQGQYATGANPSELKKPPFIGINRSGGEITIHSAELREVKDGTDTTPATKTTPVASTFGPWQPLFTDAEWKETVPGQREVVDGRVHLLPPFTTMLKPLPSADGAIRVRIQFREGSKALGIQARTTPGKVRYKIEVAQTYADLYCYTPKGFQLGRYNLPKPLQPGDTVLVELRLQGDRVTALVDGAVVIEARDARITAPGEWGVLATDGWFESVEVQTPLPLPVSLSSSSPQVLRSSKSEEGWQPLLTDAEWQQTIPGKREVVDGRLHLLGPPTVLKPQPTADGAIRARLWHKEESNTAGLLARSSADGSTYKVEMRHAGIQLRYFPPGGDGKTSEVLGEHTFPEPLKPGATVLVELRLQGDRLNALLEGAQVIEARDSRISAPGQWGIMSINGWFESVEVQPPQPLSAAPPLGPWQPLFTDAEWKETVPGQREVVDGKMHLQKDVRVLKPQPFADGAIRARIQFREGLKAAGIQARVTPGKGRYKIEVGQTYADLYRYTPGGLRLARYTLPKPLQTGDTVLVELRLQGDRLTVLVDDAVAIEAFDSNITAPGQWGVLADDGWFESVEVQTPLPAGPAITATKDAPFVNSLGMKFVPVPIVGGPTDKQRVLFSVWDTRVQDYEVFATETKREWRNPGYKQGPTHPAAGVNWDDATAFCAWLTERERKTGGIGASAHYRLPSDHEWSCAVGIGEQEDAARLPGEKNGKIAEVFPWDTAWPPPDQAGNYWSEELRPLIAAGKYPWITGTLPGRHDGFAETSPVGSYAANRFGLYDMGGNLWQWCSDPYDKAQKDRVLRGPSWELSLNSNLLSSFRRASAPAIGGTAFGFRCVLAPVTDGAANSTSLKPANDRAAAVR